MDCRVVTAAGVVKRVGGPAAHHSPSDGVATTSDRSSPASQPVLPLDVSTLARTQAFLQEGGGYVSLSRPQIRKEFSLFSKTHIYIFKKYIKIINAEEDIMNFP